MVVTLPHLFQAAPCDQRARSKGKKIFCCLSPTYSSHRSGVAFCRHLPLTFSARHSAVTTCHCYYLPPPPNNLRSPLLNGRHLLLPPTNLRCTLLEGAHHSPPLASWTLRLTGNTLWSIASAHPRVAVPFSHCRQPTSQCLGSPTATLWSVPERC